VELLSFSSFDFFSDVIYTVLLQFGEGFFLRSLLLAGRGSDLIRF
jgi:hypothetical protein